MGRELKKGGVSERNFVGLPLKKEQLKGSMHKHANSVFAILR